MSVLETVTVDNVTYDMHDPKVGSGTLSTTAQTLIPAVNEVKSGLTTVSGKTDVIGTGSLNTTNKTLIGAINELKAGGISTFGATTTSAPTTAGDVTIVTPSKTGTIIIIIKPAYSSSITYGSTTGITSCYSILLGSGYDRFYFGKVTANTAVKVNLKASQANMSSVTIYYTYF